jgi:hypothetical protein
MTSGKKIPPAVTLGMVIVNKGNKKITAVTITVFITILEQNVLNFVIHIIHAKIFIITCPT